MTEPKPFLAGAYNDPAVRQAIRESTARAVDDVAAWHGLTASEPERDQASQPVTPTVSAADDTECCPKCGIPLGVPLVHSDGCELVTKPAWAQLIADRDQARAELGRIIAERDLARTRRDELMRRDWDIRQILIAANYERFGGPSVDLVEAVRLIVGDLRIVTGAADHADATVVQLNAELASARAVGDLHTEIRGILSEAYVHGMPEPDVSIVEAVRWVVADWRIERASNEVDHDRNRTTAAASDVDQADTFDTWAIIELMGHRRLAGHVTEVQLAGHGYLRLDIPAAGQDPARTQFISPASVYALHPTGEETARAAAAKWRPAPAQRWELPGLAKPVDVDEAIADLVADQDQADEHGEAFEPF